MEAATIPPRPWTTVTFDEMEQWRSQQGYSRTKLAQLVGVTRSAYYKWARGESVPHVRTQARIRDLLDRGISPTAQARARQAPFPREKEIETVQRLVECYLETQSTLPGDELIRLVRGVRSALRG